MIEDAADEIAELLRQHSCAMPNPDALKALAGLVQRIAAANPNAGRLADKIADFAQVFYSERRHQVQGADVIWAKMHDRLMFLRSAARDLRDQKT